uniref:FAD assembly factor SdhE n=1 Tax=Globodera pallida TaxID=36090 RepID=A0A183BYQ4_GLOPA
MNPPENPMPKSCCAQIGRADEIMEELLRHRRFRENFLNLEDNSELKKRFLRLLMRENDKPEDGELL